MSKRANLAAALHDSGAKTTQPWAPPAAPEAAVATVAAPKPPVDTIKPPSREGQRVVSVYVKPEVHKQLRMLGLDKELTVQELMTEALNDLFQKHGKSRIA